MRINRLINLSIIIEFLGLIILFLGIGLFIIDPDAYYNVCWALFWTGILCTVPGIICLIAFKMVRKEQNTYKVNQLMHGAPIEDVVVGDTKEDEEMRASIAHIQEVQEVENQKHEEEIQAIDAQIMEKEVMLDQASEEQVVSTANAEDEELMARMAELEDEKTRLEAERDQLEQQRIENDKFVKSQLESALLGKGMLEIMQAEKEHLAEALRSKEEMETARLFKIQANKESRAKADAERKQVFNKANIEVYVKKNFVEVAACFLMDRDKFKDAHGVAPYNRVTITGKGTTKEQVNHVMACTEDRLYKFGELLIDAEKFTRHGKLYSHFIELKSNGMTLCRISEKLHLLYMKTCRKDFLKDYRNKGDFENLLILVNNNYELKNKDFKITFSNKPFISPGTDEDIVAYLMTPEVQHRFEESMPMWKEIGFESLYTAMYVALVSTFDLNTSAMTQVILKDATRITKLIEKEVKKTSKPKTTRKKVNVSEGEAS
jgi:hypothetical protein